MKRERVLTLVRKWPLVELAFAASKEGITESAKQSFSILNQKCLNWP